MRPIAQGVNDPDIEVLKENETVRRNIIEIRRIGEISKAEAERIDFAVMELERHRVNRATGAGKGEFLAAYQPFFIQ